MSREEMIRQGSSCGESEAEVNYHTHAGQTSLQDVKRLVYLNHEAEVKTYRDYKTRAIRNYRVRRANSPFEFWTEFHIERGLRNAKDWYEAMHNFYQDPQASLPYKVRTSVVIKFRCYAHLDGETRHWERVRVFRVDMAKGLVDIYFCDIGQFRTVPVQSLMELNPEFCTWSAQGFRTHLVHVRPIGGGYIWSKDARNYFKKLVHGKVFKTIVMTRSEVGMPDGFPDIALHIGVVMIEQTPLGTCTLQAALVKAGFAEATGICGDYPEMFDGGISPYLHFSPQGLDSADDAELVCGEAEGSVELHQMLKRARDGLESGRVLALKNQKLEREKMWEKSLYSRTLTDGGEDHFPPVFQERVGYIKFSHVMSPSCIFVQLESRMSELEEMELGISAIVENQPHLPFSESGTGVPIACLLQGDKNREAMWVRAVTKQALPHVKLLKVILVDYGNEISVKYAYSRYLPAYFRKIPAFAHRVHLDVEGLSPSGGKRWTTDAADTFRKYISSWEVEIPLYYAWRPGDRRVVHLTDPSQEVGYDKATGIWTPLPCKNSQGIEGSGEPLLSSLYTSTALDVMFEILINKGDVYYFQSLSDILVHNGYGIRCTKRDTGMDVHEAIVSFIHNNSRPTL